jgi:2-keto-4-pentenoate hydratase
MSKDRLAAIADRIVAARRQGTRIAPSGTDVPANFEEGFTIQDKVVAALASPVIGWKVMAVPNGPVIFAPILQSGRVPAGGTWELVGREPAGIELEIAFRLGRDVAPGAKPEQVLHAVESAHVVFELCQSRLAEPAKQPRHVMLADCIANAGLVLGPEIRGWRNENLKERPGRLLVDGKMHVEGKSVDPIGALQMLEPALTSRGKRLAAGQIVITGSLIGMNWLTGRHDLVGIIDGCGEVAIKLAAA